MANEYIMSQLDKLEPLRTQMDEDHFIIKIASPYGFTHYMNISYNKYFRIAQILLEDEYENDYGE